MTRWIDIKKKKPKHAQKCLICAGTTVCAAIADCNFYDDGRLNWGPCGFDGTEWEFHFWNGDVTHWMPLPAPHCQVCHS